SMAINRSKEIPIGHTVIAQQETSHHLRSAFAIVQLFRATGRTSQGFAVSVLTDILCGTDEDLAHARRMGLGSNPRFSRRALLSSARCLFVMGRKRSVL